MDQEFSFAQSSIQRKIGSLRGDYCGVQQYLFYKRDSLCWKINDGEITCKKYDGILCEENYHDKFRSQLSKKEFPCLTYTRDLEDWHDFIRRTPEEYAAWVEGVTKECEVLELRMLDDLSKQENRSRWRKNVSI